MCICFYSNINNSITCVVHRIIITIIYRYRIIIIMILRTNSQYWSCFRQVQDWKHYKIHTCYSKQRQHDDSSTILQMARDLPPFSLGNPIYHKDNFSRTLDLSTQLLIFQESKTLRDRLMVRHGQGGFRRWYILNRLYRTLYTIVLGWALTG